MKTSKHTFFCSRIDDLTLSKTEAHHAAKVLRLRVGDHINVIDGKGTKALAEITALRKQSLDFSVLSTEVQESPAIQLHIAIAPTKSNERIEFFIEKAVEIGISQITPIISKNSERQQVKLERWQKIMVAAAKQSNNLHFPKIGKVTKLSAFVNQDFGTDMDLFIAHCEDDTHKQDLKHQLEKSKNVCILIGPEGDFTPEEINLATENRFKPISLGNTRLRTETAGIVACHTVNLMLS